MIILRRIINMETGVMTSQGHYCCRITTMFTNKSALDARVTGIRCTFTYR